MNVIALILAAFLMIPTNLLAAQSESLPAHAEVQPTLPPDDGSKSEHSPETENVYLGWAIGTMIGGGVLLALGLSNSDSDCVGCSLYNDIVAGVGGATLAASTVLWVLYFNEKGKAPKTSVGLDLVNGGGLITAQHRF